MPPLIQKQKVSCEHCGTQVIRTILYGTERDAQPEPHIVPNAPTFQNCARMI